jgi:hypothetical protein
LTESNEMCGSSRALPGHVIVLEAVRAQQAKVGNAPVEVKFEKPRPDLAKGSERLDYESTKLKMITPHISTRMEQRNQLTCRRIQRGDIAAFPSVAAEAGVRQVAFFGESSMFPANDVIDLMWEIRIILVKAAILASALGAVGHQPPQLFLNLSRQAECAALLAPWPSL